VRVIHVFVFASLIFRSKMCQCETPVSSEKPVTRDEESSVSDESNSRNIDPSADLIKIEQALQKAEKIRAASAVSVHH
jgi:hypothetical protein